MKKTSLITVAAIVVVIGALLSLLFLRSPRQPTPANGNASVAVTIAQAGDFYLYAPLYIAIDQGFFQKRGANVRIVSTGGDEKTWAAVIGGDAQFGVADPTFIAIASQRGQPGKILATIVNGVPFWGITKKPKVPVITSPSAHNGFVVATFPSPSTAYTLQKEMFERAGITPHIREGAFG